MRLSMSEVRSIKELISKSQANCLLSRKVCEDLIDTIEAQQKQINGLNEDLNVA